MLQECSTNLGWQPIEIQSHSEKDVRYVVLCAAWVAPREYICECQGYKFRQRCSHQTEAAKQFCRWTEEEGTEEQTDEERRKKVCPRCGTKTYKVMEDR